MSEENKALLQRWFEEVWNKGRADAIDEMLDENGKIVEAWNNFDFMTLHKQVGLL